MVATMVCLDTDILIDNLRGRKPTVRQIKKLESAGAILSTTSINVFELYHGANKTRKRDRNLEAVRGVLERLVVFDFTEETAERAGRVLAELEARLPNDRFQRSLRWDNSTRKQLRPSI